ncbi:MAG: alanine--tRNA ligase [Saprospiraceae bacterium]|nr:alanine--tRNA ligase [Saprospiraceae bacterium]MCB9326147.1 alanine--tRNA ligase [Lewinellaceae bacterium]
MTSQEIRKTFLDFFKSKGHKIVPSSPIVNKDDPTLMFINAGMNQFKDFFLGNQTPDVPRIADTQKCLRVSGKHNDLEEVGRDSYHHTMFEMLGNWSFGEYFKKEAIAWAWELLTEVYKLDKNRLYVSVFKGEPSENLEPDEEAADIWAQYVSRDRILYFDKKDNFWEMGDSGPCGPCSEIHIDLRSEEERARIAGKDLVNADDPLVVEIWNLVFIQFNRKADGSLEELPAKHVDTGMGFERLCMAVQGKKSNYETDVFTPFIEYIEKVSGKKYTNRYENAATSDIAMRVVSDHIRAVAFAIADGQLPSNTGAGYVIRRILRRAVRYYFSFLDINEPFLHTLIPLLAERFKEIFPELMAQKDQVAKIIEGEEKSFLNTLAKGLKRLDSIDTSDGKINGEEAFELYDTFGFPIDLTRLIAEEKGLTIDEAGFETAMAAQKERARSAAQKQVGDWYVLDDGESSTFVGYDQLQVHNASVLKYRTVKLKKGNQYQIVLNTTPFYAESGGQAGDSGWLTFGDEKIKVIDTQRENDLSIHIVEKLPADLEAEVLAQVDPGVRNATENNHTATHLMHAALHRILGNNALQKGQSVDADKLRFDFSHFQKVTEEELAAIEQMVNEKIREDIKLEEERNMPIEEAKALGAMMLFGEKYGENVRVITFDKNFSRELCGGTHVTSTGKIGQFKILSEGAVAAGIRRIEAITADKAEAFVNDELNELKAVRALLKSSGETARHVEALQEENKKLKKELEKLVAAQASGLKDNLKSIIEKVNGINFIAAKLPITDANAVKTLAFQLEKELGNAVIAFGAIVNGNPQLTLMISNEVVASHGLDAGKMIREAAKAIQGGGGGQPHFATAGGKNPEGLDEALAKTRELLG